HVVGGSLHFLLGYSLFGAIDRRGVLIGILFGVIFAAGHLNQEVRDHDGDALNGIATNAVRFGKTRAFHACFVLFAFAYVYLAVLAVAALVPRALGLLTLLLPVHLVTYRLTLRRGLTQANLRRFQMVYRALFALIGLVMLGAVFL